MINEVRSGAWSYDQLIEYLKNVDLELQEIYDKETYIVQKAPDINRLQNLCQDIIEEALETNRR